METQLHLPIFDQLYPTPAVQVPDLWVNIYFYKGHQRPGMAVPSREDAEVLRQSNPANCLYRVRVRQRRPVITP